MPEKLTACKDCKHVQGLDAHHWCGASAVAVYRFYPYSGKRSQQHTSPDIHTINTGEKPCPHFEAKP